MTVSTIKPLPQRHGSPYQPQNHRDSDDLQHRTAEYVVPSKSVQTQSSRKTTLTHDFTLPLKPPVSSGKSTSPRSRSRGRGRREISDSPVNSSTGSAKQAVGKGILRVGSIASGSQQSATSHGDSGSGNSNIRSATSSAGSKGMSGNLLDACGASVESLERRFNKLIAGDGGAGVDADASSSKVGVQPPDTSRILEESVIDLPDDSVVEMQEEAIIPLKKVPLRKQLLLMQKAAALAQEDSYHDQKPLDNVMNPFSRRLPRDHQHSAGQIHSRPNQQDRVERYTNITESTVPTTNASSQGGWVDRHLKALGGKKSGGVRVFQVEEGRDLSADEIKKLHKQAKKAGVSTAAAAVLQDDSEGTLLRAEDDYTAGTAAHTVGTMGEETAGGLLVGLTSQFAKKAAEQQQKPKRSLMAEAEKAQDKRERRLERAAKKRANKEAAKARRKKDEHNRRRLEAAERAKKRKKSRVAEAGAEGRSIASVYTIGSTDADTELGKSSRATETQGSPRLFAQATFEEARSRQATRKVIGNLEVLDRDAMALESEVWTGVDEMMRDALTVTTRSRACSTVSKLAVADKSSPGTEDVGEVLLAKSALDGFSYFLVKEDTEEGKTKSSSSADSDSIITRESIVKATRGLPGHSVHNIIHSKEKRSVRKKKKKQQALLEELRQLSLRSIENADTSPHIRDMDTKSVGRRALDAFADVLLDSSPPHTPSETHQYSTGPLQDEVFDIPPAKKALLYGEQGTLFELFRWSLKVNIDASVAEHGKLERCIKRDKARRARKKAVIDTSTVSMMEHLEADKDYDIDPPDIISIEPSEMNEEEIERQLALAVNDVNVGYDRRKNDNDPDEFSGYSFSSDDGSSGPDENIAEKDDNVDEDVARRQSLWRQGIKLQRKKSERAVSLHVLNLGLLDSPFENDNGEESAKSLFHGTRDSEPLPLGQSRLSVFSAAPEESDTSGYATSGYSSSGEDDTASKAFALISSAAVPGAKMPTSRNHRMSPHLDPDSSGGVESIGLGSASTTTTFAHSTNAHSITSSAHASSHQSSGFSSSALASSRQSSGSGLKSIPEQEIADRTELDRCQTYGLVTKGI